MLCNRRQLTLPDTSNRLNTTRGYNRSGGEEDGDFPSVEELLLNTGEAQDWQRTGSKGGDCEGLTPDPSTGRNKKNPWNGQESEADNKEEDQKRYNRDGNKKTTPSPGSTKKRRPSTVEGKSASKRRRCLSPERDKAVSSQGGCGLRIADTRS